MGPEPFKMLKKDIKVLRLGCGMNVRVTASALYTSQDTWPFNGTPFFGTLNSFSVFYVHLAWQH